MRENIKLLHAAAVKGELAEPGLQQRVQEESGSSRAARRHSSGRAAASGRSSREGAGTGAQVQQKTAATFSGGRGYGSARMTIDQIPCQVCGIAEGSDMIVCDWCAASAGHLGCLGFTEVQQINGSAAASVEVIEKLQSLLLNINKHLTTNICCC